MTCCGGSKPKQSFVVPLWLNLSWVMLFTTYFFFATSFAGYIIYYMQGRFIGYFSNISEVEIGFFNDIDFSATAPISGLFFCLNFLLYSIYGKLFMEFGQTTINFIYVLLAIFWLTSVGVGVCPFSESYYGQLILDYIIFILVNAGIIFFQIVTKPFTEKSVWMFRLILMLSMIVLTIVQIIPYKVFNDYRYMTAASVCNVAFYACCLIIHATWREDVAKILFALVIEDDFDVNEEDEVQSMDEINEEEEQAVA